MPNYTYQCDGCNERKVLQVPTLLRDFKVVCDCGGGFLTRQPDAPGIAFKGSGFYVNDYKRKS